VFRVVAEAVSNVRRHASATSAKVVLAEDDAELTVQGIDDGIGFDPRRSPGPGHIGLLEMRERVEAGRGRISITSAPGRGAGVGLTSSTQPGQPAA
jgi:signal transduction histidine kinase